LYCTPEGTCLYLWRGDVHGRVHVMVLMMMMMDTLDSNRDRAVCFFPLESQASTENTLWPSWRVTCLLSVTVPSVFTSNRLSADWKSVLVLPSQLLKGTERGKGA